MRTLRLPLVLPALLAVVLLASGCGERREPTSERVAVYPVSVTGAGAETVTLREPPRRILALTLATAETLAALGVQPRTIHGPQRLDGETETPPAAIRRLRPDLVVAAPSSDGEQLARAAADAGAALYVTADQSLREVERSITQLGLLVGRPLTARRLVASIDERRRRVQTAVAGRRRARVFFDTGVFVTVSSQSLIGDLIRIAGGESVAGSRPEPGPFDLDRLARLDPDVYVATSDSGTSLRDLRRNPRTRRLTAVRSGRFGVVPTRLLRPGPDVGAGLTELARILHPDAFR